MLDRDPNPPRPPDSSTLSRPRPRPHKPKNAPKKQPQRGLGVAQLEKLRLQEQSKNEAACLASLRHHTRHQQPQPQLVHHHLHQQHPHLPQTASPLCLPLPGKLISAPESVPDKPAFSLFSDFGCSSSSSNNRELSCPRALLACGKVNCANAHNVFVPLAGVPAHNLGTLLVSPHQRSAEDNEPCLSSLSQPHNLCSPGSAISGTISSSERSGSKKGNCLTANEPSFQQVSAPTLNLPTSMTYCSNFMPGQFRTEMARQNHELGKDPGNLYVKTKDSSAALFPGAFFCTEKGMEGISGVQSDESGGTMVPFRELHLPHPEAVALDGSTPSRNRLESPVVSSGPTIIKPRELSSFQTFSATPAWSSGDQVINRKRPWVLTQETTRNPETCKCVDLNTSADEMDSESTEQDSPDTDVQRPSGVSGITSVFRDAWANSNPPILKPGLSLSTVTDEYLRPSSLNPTCTDCKNMPEDFAAKMYLVSSAVKAERSMSLTNGAPFLSIRKASQDNDALYIQQAETCGEFLTLGPSSCLNQTYLDTKSGTGNDKSIPVFREARKTWHSNENASVWQQPRQPAFEQAKGARKLLPLVSNLENSDIASRAKDVHDDGNCSPLHLNVGLSACLAWTNADDHACHVHSHSVNGGPPDLDLRLSL